MKGFIINDISINIFIGFFYSAIIGSVTLFLTEKLMKKKDLRSLSVDITKLTFILNTISSEVNNISNLDGPKYRQFFADVLDKKDVELKKLESINEFIIYDEISYLPNLSDYLIYKFENKLNELLNNKDKDLMKLLKNTKELKQNYIIENNIFLIQYNNINSTILRLNHKLNYYRELTLQIIGIEVDQLKEGNIATENKIRVFKYCIDSLISESKYLIKQIEMLEKTVIHNRQELIKEINKNNKILNRSIKAFIIVFIVSLIFLMIA
ncbi:hypothetical protein DWC20_08810 [Clostridium botulinum]|uniref:hypothetical protein n=1 Tax=Clostridium botulinum TaxID=1491 RepID=UPI0003785C80|nr:hypothetical protein [Clostridium botulinum]MBN1035644.1 hypothetical protein [Clostridium botulinum]NFO12247.1 hypothetical protein [Clostridium botulinum]